jgi:hypothetical protein
VRGLAEMSSGQEVGVRLRPFVAPHRCQVELSFPGPAHSITTQAKATRTGAEGPAATGADRTPPAS